MIEGHSLEIERDAKVIRVPFLFLRDRGRTAFLGLLPMHQVIPDRLQISIGIDHRIGWNSVDSIRL